MNISSKILNKILVNHIQPYIKGLEIRKEEIKLSLSADDLIFYKILKIL